MRKIDLCRLYRNLSYKLMIYCICYANSAVLQYYRDSTTNKFIIKVTQAPNALTTYTYDYLIME
jgi:hypothetical protein